MNDTDTELRRQLGRLRTLEPSPESVSERVRRRVTRRRRRRWAVRCAAVVALGVGAVTAHTLSSDPSGRPHRVITGQPGPRSSTSSSVRPDSTTRHDPGPAAALVADPTSGLRDGSVVGVHGQVPPAAYVSVVQCVAARVPEVCAVADTTEVRADEAGTWEGQFAVRRWIGFPGSFVDCASHDCRLYVNVGSGAGPVAGVSLTMLDDGTPAPTPTLTVRAAGTLRDGQVVQLTGTGLPPDAPIDLGVCRIQAGPQESPPCILGGGNGRTDARGSLDPVDYRIHLHGYGLDCSKPPGCELAWYPWVGSPPYVRHPLSGDD